MTIITTRKPAIAQALVLERLKENPATAAELAVLLYGENTEYTQDNVFVVIHRLRKRGIPIATMEPEDRVQPRRYCLADNGACPYCNGTGKLIADR